ncbi:hypothetical protein LTR94_033391, partial [Friedmanniomyces endolithicus]
TTTGIDPDANAAELVAAIREAAGNGAAMVFTPEMSGLLDRDRARAAAQEAAAAQTRRIDALTRALAPA